MTTTDTQDEVEGAVSLMAALAAQSAADLAHTTNALLANAERQEAFWRSRFVSLYDRVCEEPQVSRSLHDTLDYLAVDVDNARAKWDAS